MSGALGLFAAFAGFCCLIYAAKGSQGTQWDGQIAPGPVMKQLLLGNWPYDAIIVNPPGMAPGKTASSTTTPSSGGGVNV